MGLRAQAAADLAVIAADTDGFGWSFTITDPDGVSAEITGLSADIGQEIDPETGIVVVGRKASVAIPIAALTAAGLGVPRGIYDDTSKPWRVTVNDITGTSHEFKVSHAAPDLTIGLVLCFLGGYTP